MDDCHGHQKRDLLSLSLLQSPALTVGTNCQPPPPSSFSSSSPPPPQSPAALTAGASCQPLARGLWRRSARGDSTGAAVWVD
jgi:hypothetical protein